MVDRPVSKGYENMLTLEDSLTPATPTNTAFSYTPSPNPALQPNFARPSTAVKPFSNESVWLSVKTLDGEPSADALRLGTELDPTKTLIYLVGLYSKCLALCGTVSKILRRGISGTEELRNLSPRATSKDPFAGPSQTYQHPTHQPSPLPPYVHPNPPSPLQDTPPFHDVVTTRTALQAELEAFRASLPEWARNVDKYPGDDPTRAQRYPIYHVMVLQIAWHAAMLVLWFPVVLDEEGGLDGDGTGGAFSSSHQQQQQGGHAQGQGYLDALSPSASSSRSSFQSDAYTHCLDHVFQISTLLDAMGPESGLYPGYYLAWILYHPAVILSLEAHKQGGEESHEGVRVKRMVEKVIGVMRDLARRSFVAGVIADNTEKILGGGGWDVGGFVS